MFYKKLNLIELGFIATGFLSSNCFADLPSNYVRFDATTAFLRNSTYWDYSPAWMADQVAGKDRMWVCSSDGVSNQIDVIKYSEKIGNGSWNSAQTVLKPSLPWEGPCTCDPAVIRGNFKHNNISYSHALYYTAAKNCADTAVIGVAFSNDGINWVKNANPIVNPQYPNSKTYGAGQAQIRSIDGGAKVMMWHTDTVPNPSGTGYIAKLFERTSNNGVLFTTPQRLTDVGIDNPKDTGGFALSLSPGLNGEIPYLYLIDRNEIGLDVCNAGEMIAYRIPFQKRFNGVWEKLGVFHASHTPNPSNPFSTPRSLNYNFEAGFRNDMHGNLFVPSYPDIYVGFGCGNNYPLVGDAQDWSICYASFRAPASPPLANP